MLRRSWCLVGLLTACSGSASPEPTPCGDALVDPRETCDDGNDAPGDGCLACAIEPGWSCDPGSPSVCNALCGDGLVRGDEGCDDGNTGGSDGCTSECRVRRGWVCSPAEPSACAALCGDGERLGRETCDDGNTAAADGCADDCAVELGWSCPGPLCEPICGDGLVLGSEQCDDGNLTPGDACNPSCQPTALWRPVRTFAAPLARHSHASVWTGTEVIVFGGLGEFRQHADGGAYAPQNRRWRPLSVVGAPEGRYFHTMVWSGQEALVWGGENRDANTRMAGGRYDPSSDTWRAMSTAGAPRGRTAHIAAWTGREMLIWGGLVDRKGPYLDDGARYDPALDAWTPMSQVGAPSPRAFHFAAWSGRELIIWGGDGEADDGFPRDGARYDPELDAWTPMSDADAPSRRSGGVAQWVGSAMFVFGGENFDNAPGGPIIPREARHDGGLYDPVEDRWTPIGPAPGDVGGYATNAVFDGSNLLVFGGCEAAGPLGDGAVFTLATRQWRPMSTDAAPSARCSHSAAWTGSRMFVWAGSTSDFEDAPFDDGALYDAEADAWTALVDSIPPTARSGHLALLGDDEVFVFGGERESVTRSGGRYRIREDRWSKISEVGAPAPRTRTVGAWTGTQYLVWGGRDEAYRPLDDGAHYDPATDAWTPMSASPLAGREGHTAVWTGTEMIVWGGTSGGSGAPGDGARYDPTLRAWTRVSRVGAPRLWEDHAAVWTGTEMLVWGSAVDGTGPTGSGAAYDPTRDVWTPIASRSAPSDRRRHTAVWTGVEMIIWGGVESETLFADGARYDPVARRWSPMAAAPLGPRYDHTAAWTSHGLVIWGGDDGGTGPTQFGDGARYDATTDRWWPLPALDAPTPRARHSGVWTGRELVIFGGEFGENFEEQQQGEGARLILQ